MVENETHEVWAAYPERPQYEVSNLGRIRGPQGLRKPKNSKDGYLRIGLGPRPAITRTMHSMVAIAFLGPRPQGHVVAHKNRDKSDNRLSNLMYATYRANMLHCRHHGVGRFGCPLTSGGDHPRWGQSRRGKMARGERHGMAKLTEVKVLDLHRLYDNGNRTARSVSIEAGIPYKTVMDVLAGRRWRHLHPDVTLRR